MGSEGIPGRIQVDSSISHFLSPDSVGIVDIERETPVHIVSFMIPESRLIYLLDELESGLPILVEKKILCTTENPYLHIGTVTPELKSVIDHIRLCHMHGNLRCLYLEGKLLELTALRLEQLHYDVPVLTSGAFPRLRKRDIERIREATDIIKSHLEEPLSISQLSRRVGINATKLKKGFSKGTGEHRVRIHSPSSHGTGLPFSP